MTVEVLGIDHVYLAVASLEGSESFYDRVLVTTLGFRKSRFALGGAAHVQYYNRQLGIVIRPAAGPPDDTGSPGLHHLCLRVETAADVRTVADTLRGLGVDATEPRAYPEYADDYVATFFRDPDGIRLEVTNFRTERRRRMAHWDTEPV